MSPNLLLQTAVKNLNGKTISAVALAELYLGVLEMESLFRQQPKFLPQMLK